MNELLEQVAKSIRERRLFERGERILIAVSGGLDSMVLLRLLDTLARGNRSKLVVAHFNHRLRGRSSDADERLVRQTTRRMGWPVVVERGDVRAFARKHGLSVEMAARTLRHRFLARAARRLKIRNVALAHHADDQVEHFFLRLLRGTGAQSLAGMNWFGPSPADSFLLLNRPLLDVRKSDLNAFAREFRVQFREDATNALLDIQRNRVRHELLPLLRRRFQPALEEIVLRTMNIIGAESEVVTQAAQAWLKLTWDRPCVSFPIGVQRRAIQLQLQRKNITATFDLIEALRGKAGKLVNISPRSSVMRDKFGRLRFNVPAATAFDRKQIKVVLRGRAGEVVFDGVRLNWRFNAGKSLPRSKRQRRCEYFDADSVGSQIVLRHWRAGDRYQPIGMSARVKLQDWFTNQKISLARRRELIIATTAGGEIFWIEGQRISERFKLTPDTRNRLVWRWKSR